MLRGSWLVLLLAGLAFAQTMAYFVYLRDDPGHYNSAGAGGDQVAYIELAQQVREGRWDGRVHYLPGLPVAIALGQTVVGDPRLGIAILHGLVYAALVLAVARVATDAFGARAAPWSAGLVALNPALGYYAAQALTELLTGALLFGVAATTFYWSRRPTTGKLVAIGLLIALAGYLRSEYLALAVVFGAVVAFLGPGRRLLQAGVVAGVVLLAVAPWVVRYAVVTGKPSLYNESPFSNLTLMGTWFRVFDEQTFAQLQQIETASMAREEAIARAGTVGPRPDLSARYMEQARGPYERPLGETLSMAAENVRLNLRQYLVNHFLLAPVLIWAGHTPVRQADVASVPSVVRYGLWGLQLVVLLLALWQAFLSVRDPRQRALSLAFLGVVAFLSAVHLLIAVDDRFTIPALPLVGTFAGARVSSTITRWSCRP
jgi:4-amino-4-deoxy-L-arabinose transferase-like glycosyltransferase